MQSAPSKRLLSTLASKLHPQLPLSPRESQQLLNLLTTSFRAHLDREHPITVTKRATKQAVRHAPPNAPQHNAPSSHATATRHIDAILTNPLFAVKPSRRASEAAAVDILRDPMAWFVNQIALGSADLPKAAMCLDLLESTANAPARLHNGKSPAEIMSTWLQTSGLDRSREFVELQPSKGGFDTKSLERLVALIFSEGQTAAPWRWFIRSQDLRVKETRLEVLKVTKFRQQLLHKMVLRAGGDLAQGVRVFMQAFRMAEVEGLESTFSALRAAGAHIVNCIITTNSTSVDPETYNAFLASTPRWLGNWSPAVEAILWLHHPTKSTTLPALRYINDPTGASLHIKASKGRRHFLVQLCLGVARQSLETEQYADAQIAMAFAKLHFPDLVLSKPTTPGPQAGARQKARKERENLELLDSLVPA
ncbi:hypothetical protein FB567DRAFT_334714 [Paraphoma chrysanthemicola]|uniref:Uncharacterized protein n=1 Tax=Paraphoma chrysanthemicola TaxID=798071 RepID=A0A8K0R796_9PLEO|nr:hypothetical protein FB567DRAFT_334714 [Paraphoma chrysanthemicola]